MGYGYYRLSNGREAGYGVEAECDEPGCSVEIDRGLGYLCGNQPYGFGDDDDDWRCRNYYCPEHMATHECDDPA